MPSHPRHLIRVAAISGIVLTALPLARVPWAPVQHASASRMQVMGFSPALVKQATTTPQRMIFVLRQGQSSSDLLQTLQRTGARNIESLGLINAVAAQVPAQTLQTLQFNPELLEMAIDRQHQPLPNPDGAAIAEQLAHAQLQRAANLPPGVTPLREPDTLSIIHADAVQKQYDGAGVRVAIVDSGIDLGHPDLSGVMLKDAAGHPLYADFTGTDLTDTVGHGTAVAGWIVAQGKTVYSVNNTYRASVFPQPNPATRFNTTTYFTVNGIAPGVKLMAAKIFDTRLTGGGGFDSTIVRAIEWAIANHADVISESFGQTAVVQTNPTSDIVALADEQAVHHGITVVAADGNDGPGASSVSSPAQTPGVIAAGASTDYQAFAQTGYLMNYNAGTADSIQPFSSRGPTYDGRMRPDLYAPGGWGWTTIPRYPNELSSGPPNQIFEFGGTSAATPAVTASAALVIEAYRSSHGGKTPTPAYVKQVLTSTADDLGYPAEDQAAGRVDVQRAVALVTRKGPSLLLSGALSLHGQQGDRPTQTFAVTNTGTTVQKVTFHPQVVSTAVQLHYAGTTVADHQYTYRFTVPAGIARLTASLYWKSTLQLPLPNANHSPEGMIVRLYDPQGNFVNYNGSGSGGPATVKTTAGRPVPGTWTAVVTQRRISDANSVAHYINVPFQGVITMDRFTSSTASTSPASLTLRPGQHAKVTFDAGVLKAAGTHVVTVHVDEQSIAAVGSTDVLTSTVQTLPAVITTDIALNNGHGTFAGAFTGAGDTGVYEVYYYPFRVSAGTANLAVTLKWLHPNNQTLLILLDPQGHARAFDSNAVETGGSNSGPINLTAPPTGGTVDLSQKEVDSFVNEPDPGLWRVEAINNEFAGSQPSEQFTGAVHLNMTVARLNQPSLTAAAGGDSVPFAVQIANPFGGLQDYFLYATTNNYGYVSLGGTGGTLQDGPLAPSTTQMITYTTNFVPPGTREVVTQAEAIHSPLPVGITLTDPDLGTFAHFGLPAPEMLGGVSGQGTVAQVTGTNLPVGQWEADLTLPVTKHTGPVTVAANSFAYSLIPNNWITTDAQLSQNGLVSTRGLQPSFPGSVITYHGSVHVPALTAPGAYHAHIFVYSFSSEQWADLPLTIKVTAPAAQPYPTPQPYLADTVASQYFGEGVTGQGITTMVDLVNPGTGIAHVQIKTLTATGWTSLMRYSLDPHSRKSVNLQSLVGGSQAIASIVEGDQAIVSGRQILRTGASGSYSLGAVAPSTNWYFADGYTVDPFQEYLTVLNPTDHVAHVHVHLVSDQGVVKDGSFQVLPSGRYQVRVSDLLSGAAVSATVSSDVPVVAERTELFGKNGEGVSTATGATAGVTSGYLDAGHLPAGSQGHLALYNPHSKTAHVVLTLLNSGGAVAHTLPITLKAGQRHTVDLSALYNTVSLGTSIRSDVPVVVEKVGYFGDFHTSAVGGTDVLAIPAPAIDQVFPGGTTAGGSTDFLSLYNPGTTLSHVVLTVLYDGNKELRHPVNVPAGKRIGVSINALGLPNGPSSLLVDTTDGSAVYATQTLQNAKHTDGAEVTGLQLPG